MQRSIPRTIALLPLAALIATTGAAQTSHHRADFTSASGDAGIAAMDLARDGQFSVVVDAPEGLRVDGARLVTPDGVRELEGQGVQRPFHAKERLTEAEIAALGSGEVILVLDTAEGPLLQPVTDIGTSTYGAGGAPEGLPPAIAGLGHVMPGTTVTVAVNGATPGRLGAFLFSNEAGGGVWAPGVPRTVGATIGSELRVPDGSGRAEWRGEIPVGTVPGAELYVQYVEVEASGAVASSAGVRITVRQAAGLVVDLRDDRVELRTANGIVLTSAGLTDAGVADPATQTFAGADADETTAPTLPSTILAHPAFAEMIAPLQSASSQPFLDMHPAEAEQRLLGGGGLELLGPWALGWEVNGCTMIPWNTPFEDCCNVHDMLYGAGGTEADRLQADIQLAECVLAKTGNVQTSKMVFEAVRAHGGKYFNYSGPALPAF